MIGAALAAERHFLWVYCPAHRPGHPRSTPRCRGHEPDPVAVLPLVAPRMERLPSLSNFPIFWGGASGGVPEYSRGCVPMPWRKSLLCCQGRKPVHRHATRVGDEYSSIGFNRRKLEADRKAKVDAEGRPRRATDGQVLADAQSLVAAWNERQARRTPLLFTPTIGAALAAGHHLLWLVFADFPGGREAWRARILAALSPDGPA
jgi:hypothetical protein